MSSGEREQGESHGEVVVYEAPDGAIRVDVRLERETVWLTQKQMADLFDTSTDNVGLHLKNIFSGGELDERATTEDSSVVRTEGRRTVRRRVKHYNLDAIISVGYRVNSRRGTQFRIWATGTLREHLLRGYTLNERRLRERGFGEIEEAIGLLARTLTSHALITDEGRTVLDVVRRYTRAWRLLLEYDEARLATVPERPVAPTAGLTLSEARTGAASLRAELTKRGEARALFGQERDDRLAGILGAVEQTFDGEALYPSAQARAAHLLYFLVKDHPFADGNKRIGALLFLEYLRRNELLLRSNGEPRLADNAMVALTLLIAESAPEQKELMIRLVLNLLDEEAR